MPICSKSAALKKKKTVLASNILLKNVFPKTTTTISVEFHRTTIRF